MGQTASTASSAEEERMKKRIRQTMGTFSDFGAHVKHANEWAKLCPTPKTCYLSFRMIVNDRVSMELLPYVWRIRGNVYVEVRKLRRRTEFANNSLLPSTLGFTFDANREASEEVIGIPKLLSLRQFYYVFCFLSDIKACAAHTVQFPERDSTPEEDPHFDDTECQICMDKKKQVALPCTHSFCLSCFQHWSAQNNTCPICRSKIECSEGSDLWQLTSNDVRDLGSYATDLVARIFEFLEKRDQSTYEEEDFKRSEEIYATASAIKSASLSKLLQTELLPTTLPLGLSSVLGRVAVPTEVDSDFMLALELSSGEDQFAAFRQYEQMRRDQVLAMAIAMEVEDEEM
ncbi:hypothetical protein Poli38472_009711 [Pythium oligandrum]|uniref:RING finger protein 141 n=1 Tax=Pythium oligandrum TaxID=41045 RepID=A0A8K1FL06_PYTOL|nr:hypothetical protein Poli38472_009711 [Pythium oligandrum]|eukprot:TMW62218.1 hypothetical protein Poli38472_009711 [Pythium oligandrum]